MIIHILANESHLINKEAFLTPSQSSEETTFLYFETSEEWDSYTKKEAYFSYMESEEFKVEVGSQNTAEVPSFVLARPGFKVRLVGSNAKKKTIFQSDILTIPVDF